MSEGMSRGSGSRSTEVVTWVAVDTGGTFTDVVAWREGAWKTIKVPSTPDDPSQAILQGLREVTDLDEATVLLHGSTVATNAILERKGAAVALVTNRGFEDVLEIGRQNRPQLYALVGRRPAALVPPARRFGIGGRLDEQGRELEPLDPEELAALSTRLIECGAEAVAICLLHGYADPVHETTVADALAPLGLPLSVSSALLPEYREYERTSTTVVNAYVAPTMGRYLRQLERDSGARSLTVMGSNGGTLSVDRAVREPAHTVLSGPAGGVVGALAWGRRAGFPHVLTFDMGGTSTDVSLCPGRPLHTREFAIDGRPVALPFLDIHTVGAGGGSLARVDPGGALRVGPESAGAVPGPICYGRGGTQVTVTDAHVWLGRLPARAFLGGEGRLDRSAIEGPLSALAESLGASLEEAAEGVLAVADAAMERALRVISVERGHDPAGFALVAFGGAGALHAAQLAGRLGCAGVLVPPGPGLLSAYGILTAPPTREVTRTLLSSTADPDALPMIGDALRSVGDTALEAIHAEGMDAEGIDVTLHVDARYRGQSFELRVPADTADHAWVERFHAAHERRYGYRRDDAPVEVVTVRATATSPAPPIEPQPLAPASKDPPTESYDVWHEGALHTAVGVWRADLGAEARLEGPAVMLDYSATTWIPPRWVLRMDRWGVAHLTPAPPF